MDLGGVWRAAPADEELRRTFPEPALDDSGWLTVSVPSHWRSSSPELEASDGPVMYRHRFEAPPPEEGARAFLTFHGVFYQGDAWMDGAYLGDTEGYFFPQSFEVTQALFERTEHLLAIEVTCHPQQDRTAKRNLTGVFQHWDCIDPDWNPGGIWAPVTLDQTGPAWFRSLKVLCREATSERGVLEIEADVDVPEPASASLVTTVARKPANTVAARLAEDHVLAAGRNIVRWRVAVEAPDLWWPHSLGEQPLYDVQVRVELPGKGVSDTRSVTTGFRRVELRDFIANVNGERLFLKGANCGPTRRGLGDAAPEEFARDVCLAREAGLDLLRVHAHITRPELYEAADRQGMLIWQDMPLQWGYGQVRRQATRQARRAVTTLGHHPSIAVWCGHNEPMAVDFAPGTALAPKTVARVVAAQLLPTWNKSALDRSIRRALERADPTRPVVAHSGVVPHPAWGTDSHFYFGWYHGDERDFPAMLSRFPVMARFVSEFGAQAVPEEAEFMQPDRWPELDWEVLEAHHCLQREIFNRRVPPSAYATFEEWRSATQAHQAQVLRHHIETLRRLKYRPTGGFCLFFLADAQPAVTWSILDHTRQPKAAYQVVTDACAPVIIAADRPAASYAPGESIDLAVHVVSDLRRAIPGAVARAVLSWPGGDRTWRFAGEVPADSCTLLAHISHDLPASTVDGEVTLDLNLRWDGGEAKNSYTSRVRL